MNSCVYRGKVFHKRFMPVMHSFIYTLDYIYLNLDEIESTFETSFFWSANKTNWVSFKRQDYLPSTRELKDEVYYQIQEISGENFTGEVYMLTTLRSLGYCMNPITLFYCFDKETQLRHVLVEVHNTPWNQRHTYLLSGPDFNDTTQKKLHVSPFMPMDATYEWGIGDPEEVLNVSIMVSQKDQRLFNANMALERVEITRANQLVFIHLRQAFRMIVGIYFHAFKLWIKKVPFYAHPDKKSLNNK